MAAETDGDGRRGAGKLLREAAVFEDETEDRQGELRVQRAA